MKPIRSNGDIALVKLNCHVGLTSRTNPLINDRSFSSTCDTNRHIDRDLSDLQWRISKVREKQYFS